MIFSSILVWDVPGHPNQKEINSWLYKSIMNRLPLEIVHRILEYDGRIKYRHGKYMNQIAQDDDRYKMLLTVPKIETCYNHYLYMTITGNGNKIFCEKYETLWYHYGENPIINIYTSSKI